MSDLLAGLVARAPERPVTVSLARYRFDIEAGRPSIAFDSRIQVDGVDQPRLIELRMLMTPFEVAALTRDMQRSLEAMNSMGLLRSGEELPSEWAATTGVRIDG